MILVDSSVWIDYFRSVESGQVAMLDSLLGRAPLAVGDMIAAEVLQGVRDQREFNRVKKALSAFEPIDLAGYDLAVRAAQNYRLLRSRGVTVRKTINAIIATRCIEDCLTLLHADRDFLPFVEHLGLLVAYTDA